MVGVVWGIIEREKVWTWSMGHMMPKSAERMATTAFGGGGAGRVVGVVGIVEFLAHRCSLKVQ